MPGLDHDFVELSQDVFSEQAHVVLDRLQVVLVIVIQQAVPEHLANLAVVVDHLVNPVVIPVEVQAQNAQHKNFPKLHTRTACALVHIIWDQPLQNGKNPFAQLGRDVNVLESLEQLGDVVSGFIVQSDLGDWNLSQLKLGVDCLSHGGLSVEDIV